MQPARKALKGDGEEGFRAHTQAITMNEIFRRPQSDIKARVTVSVWTGSQVGFVSFTHRFGLQSTFGTSRTDMQVISFDKSFQFRFLVVDRSTRMLLYNKDLSLTGFVSKVASVKMSPISFFFSLAIKEIGDVCTQANQKTDFNASKSSAQNQIGHTFELLSN